MAADIARQVLNTHFDDEEDTFDYVLALALDGEDVTPFLVEACDDDEEAAAALAQELVEKLRLAGHISVASESATPVASEQVASPQVPEALPPVPEEAATKAPRQARRSKSPPKPKERRSKSPPKPPPIVAEDDEEAALQQQLDDTDDFASAWSACAAQGKAWGGRGAGGRRRSRANCFRRRAPATLDASDVLRGVAPESPAARDSRRRSRGGMSLSRTPVVASARPVLGRSLGPRAPGRERPRRRAAPRGERRRESVLEVGETKRLRGVCRCVFPGGRSIRRRGAGAEKKGRRAAANVVQA